MLNNIIFRILVKLGWTTKGAALTWNELDTNIEILVDYLLSLNSTNNVSVYDPGTVYSNVIPDYVSFNGNIYVYINATPMSGVTPGTDPTVWELTTTGALAHIQGTDQWLDVGGPNATSVTEIRNFLDTFLWKSVDKAALDTLVSGGDLKVGGIYYVTDRRIWIRAIDINKIAPRCVIEAHCADFQLVSGSVTGEFHAGLLGGTVTVNSIYIWNNLHYQNTTGNVDAALYPPSDGTNWTLLPYPDATYQIEHHRGTYVYGTGATDRIVERIDDKRNVMIRIPEEDRVYTGSTYNMLEQYFIPWGCDRIKDLRIVGTEVQLATFRGEIKEVEFRRGANDNGGSNTFILGDDSTDTSIIRYCRFLGSFTTGTFEPTGTIEECEFHDFDFSSLPIGINLNGNKVTEKESDIEVTVSFTGGGTLDLNTGGEAAYAGIIKLTSTNPFESLTQITATTSRRLRIQPATGGTLALLTVSGLTGLQLPGTATTINLGNTGAEYVEFQYNSDVAQFVLTDQFTKQPLHRETFLTADAAITGGGGYVTGPQLSTMYPGTYLIVGQVTVELTGVSDDDNSQIVVKLWDGTTAYAIVEMTSAYKISGGTDPVATIAISALVILTTTATPRISVAADDDGAIKAETITVDSGVADMASSLRAIPIP